MSVPEGTTVRTDLVVGGMTCAACVARVEKRLARIEGVTDSVNLATGTARVEHGADVPVERLISTAAAAGYTARLPEPEPEPDASGAAARAQAEAAAREEARTAARVERERLPLTALLALPVLLLSMVPSWQFRNWQWHCFALAAPVAGWSAWPFHRRALRGLREGTATMDTLASVGVAASFGWSCYALFLGGAGAPGMRTPFSLLPSAQSAGMPRCRPRRAPGCRTCTWRQRPVCRSSCCWDGSWRRQRGAAPATRHARWPSSA